MATRAGGRIEWLIEQAPKLTGPEFMVLTYQLLKCVDRDGKHWRSSASIGDALGMSERAVQRVQRELDHLGLIDRTPRWRKDGGKRSTLVYVMAPGVHRFHPD